ncbi:MAG: carboxypeptidase-like regulatory domain-containing protein [Bacteroidota bacterium]
MKTPHRLCILLAYLVLLLISSVGSAQEITQNIKGLTVDQDSKSPLIGATVVVLGSDPLKGAITGIDGTFVIPEVPIGRVTLKVTYIG